MAWVLDHLGALITVAIVIAGWLNQRRRGPDGRPLVDEDGNPVPRPSAEATRPIAGGDDEGELARKIREEIRRKIAERAGREPAPVAPTRETVERPAVTPPPMPEPTPVAVATAKASDDGERELARQQRLAEQLAALKATRKRVEVDASAASPEVANQPVDGWRGELRGPGSLRRAIVMREVLGPPVALR